MELTAEGRRENILSDLRNATSPRTASSLAGDYSVSRQIIVGDIAILRAAGHNILATPRGYIYDVSKSKASLMTELIACRHTKDQMQEELYTIVDNGSTVIDVTVEHPIYGDLSGNLNLSSRFDVDVFINKFDELKDVSPISVLTGGTHLHRIGAKDKDTLLRVRNSLKEKGMLID